MAKASDNVFPKLIVSEGTVPASPSAGQQKLYIDSADHKLKRVNSSGAVTTIEGGSGGGGSAETYDAAASAALTGIVHRWKFDDASGTTVADSVGSLPLTMSGTYTRHTASLLGFGTTFGASAAATSTGLGSIPVGTADRCLIHLFRSTVAGQAALSYYGAQSTRNYFSTAFNQASNTQNVSLTPWSDDLSGLLPSIKELQDATSGPDWHLAAFGYVNSAQTIYMYFDGSLYYRRLGGTLSTTATGNFVVGGSVGGQFLGDFDDVIVMNNWPGKAKLDRLFAAAAGVVYTP